METTVETTVDAKGEPGADDLVVLWKRSRCIENRDPWRRCYYGAFADAVVTWTQWEVLDRTTRAVAERRLAFWVDLNEYAVSQRGELAKCEFVIRKPEEGPPKWLPGRPIRYYG